MGIDEHVVWTQFKGCGLKNGQRCREKGIVWPCWSGKDHSWNLVNGLQWCNSDGFWTEDLNSSLWKAGKKEKRKGGAVFGLLFIGIPGKVPQQRGKRYLEVCLLRWILHANNSLFVSSSEYVQRWNIFWHSNHTPQYRNQNLWGWGQELTAFEVPQMIPMNIRNLEIIGHIVYFNQSCELKPSGSFSLPPFFSQVQVLPRTLNLTTKIKIFSWHYMHIQYCLKTFLKVYSFL